MTRNKMTRVSGTCKWFDIRKGFGFLAPNDGSEDVFVHQTELKSNGFRSLGEGEEVEFTIIQDENDNNRSKASNVTGPDGSDLQGARRRKRKNPKKRSPPEVLEAEPNQVFVGNLSWETTDEQLGEHFAAFNPTNVEVKRYNETRSKGWGLVSFGSEEDMNAAIADKHESDLDGRSIVVRSDRGSTVREDNKNTVQQTVTSENDGTTVFVGNLPWSVSDAELGEAFSSLAGYQSSEIVTKSSGLSKGFGFVYFSSSEDADEFVNNGQVYNFGEGDEVREASIKIKENRQKKKQKKQKKQKPRKELPTSGRFLFVGNVTWETSSSDLGRHFQECDGLASAEIKIRNDGRSSGFGIVEFDTEDQAAAALDHKNGSVLMERTIVVRYDKEQQ